MIHKQARIFIADFETTVFEGQTFTEVWASACVEMYSDEVLVFHSIDEQFEYFKSLKCNVIAYYHNLKFDGSFWLPYLLQKLKFKQALRKTGEGERDVEWIEDKYMTSRTFKYMISEQNMWYSFKIKVGKYFIELRDSYKLLPFAVKKIGISFKTQHQKLSMEYEGLRWAGCPISDKEKEYIANDVLVVKEAMEIMFNEGNTNLTIGACCLKEFKKQYRNRRNTDEQDFIEIDQWQNLFPDMYQIDLPEGIKCKYTEDEKKAVENDGLTLSCDYYIRKSYKGGWCYLVKGKENKIYKNGITADVNSLYPSVMSSESGSVYPVGVPTFWSGNYIHPDALRSDPDFDYGSIPRYYFVRIKTRFYLKEGMLPTVQIKHSFLYPSTEWLESSDIVDKKTGKHIVKYKDINGKWCDTRVTMTMTMTDFILFKEHYDLVDFEILDGCWFKGRIGIFDQYIEKYKQKKLNNKGALRELAKLFLNNLYGKMASSDDSSYKVAYEKDDETLGYFIVAGHEKKPGYIPVGSAITSYARNFTIRAAQKNYHGKDKPGFIYADTDSIHCNLKADQLEGIKVHDKNFCCWKLETSWDEAIFARQKTYVEHVVEENLEPIEEPYYNMKCAGMTPPVKHIFSVALNQNADYEGYIDDDNNFHEWSSDEREFLFESDSINPKKHTLSEFKIGLKIPSNRKAKQIKGGTIIYTHEFNMRG